MPLATEAWIAGGASPTSKVGGLAIAAVSRIARTIEWAGVALHDARTEETVVARSAISCLVPECDADPTPCWRDPHIRFCLLTAREGYGSHDESGDKNPSFL